MRLFHRTRADRVSAAWLRRQEHADQRVEFHGPRITLPIVKPHEQNSRWNAFVLRRQAARRSA